MRSWGKALRKAITKRQREVRGGGMLWVERLGDAFGGWVLRIWDFREGPNRGKVQLGKGRGAGVPGS